VCTNWILSGLVKRKAQTERGRGGGKEGECQKRGRLKWWVRRERDKESWTLERSWNGAGRGAVQVGHAARRRESPGHII
jgi:hypothetical protein